MWHILRLSEKHIGVWWGNLHERNQMKDLGTNGKIISKWIVKK